MNLSTKPCTKAELPVDSMAQDQSLVMSREKPQIMEGTHVVLTSTSQWPWGKTSAFEKIDFTSDVQLSKKIPRTYGQSMVNVLNEESTAMKLKVTCVDEANKSQLLPFLLSIHLGREERRYIPEGIFVSFVDQVQGLLFNPKQGERPPKVNCAFWGWRNGRGLIGCLDEFTSDRIREAADSLKPNGESVKAWGRGEFGSFCKMSFFVPDSFRLPLDKIIDRMIDQNNLPGECKVFYIKSSFKTLRDGTHMPGKYFLTDLDKKFAEAISSLPEQKVFVGLSQISVTILGKNDDKAISMDESKLGSSMHTKTTKQTSFKLAHIPSREEYIKMTPNQRKRARNRMKLQGIPLFDISRERLPLRRSIGRCQKLM